MIESVLKYKIPIVKGNQIKTINIFKTPEMKISLKSIFGIKPGSKENSSVEKKELEDDKYVDFYYTNLINSIILFTYNAHKLEEMAPILIDPLTELHEELEYAFTPVCFETIFRLEVIDKTFKDELLEFKKDVDNIPPEIWDWEFIVSHETWQATRNSANVLLEKLGVISRLYNDDYTLIYDKKGNIIRKGKKST